MIEYGRKNTAVLNISNLWLKIMSYVLTSIGLTMSPVRLKRYEGFEQGLNTIPASKGNPYK